jgi:hypothetical protein
VAEVTADLLGAPTLKKQLGDRVTELVVGVDPTAVVTCSSRGGSPVGIEGLISAAGWCVAP